eukprot:s2461_g1.t1
MCVAAAFLKAAPEAPEAGGEAPKARRRPSSVQPTSSALGAGPGKSRSERTQDVLSGASSTSATTAAKAVTNSTDDGIQSFALSICEDRELLWEAVNVIRSGIKRTRHTQGSPQLPQDFKMDKQAPQIKEQLARRIGAFWAI